MRITSKKVFFIISEEETGPRRPLVWCELPVSFYFKEYHLVGVNEQHNEIYLEVPTGKNNVPNLNHSFNFKFQSYWQGLWLR